MCGIAGYQGSKPGTLIDQMANAVYHRGPDYRATHLFSDKQTALAHTRLSIIDLSTTSNQPMWNRTKSHCIVFNGEIYNYQQLRDDLKQKNYRFNSAGDTEVLLNLCIEYGEKGLQRLNGIFAFALWSEKDQSLFLARDQMGVKPLYYAVPDSGFVFASELKALLCDRSVSRSLDRMAMAHYLQYLWCPSPRTPLLAVKKLEPGNCLHIRNGRILHRRRYYSLPQSDPNYSTLKQNETRLYETLQGAVQRQLVADVKVGAFLSGGLDSSAIVAMASRRLGAKNLPCYTIAVEGGAKEGMHADLPYAKKVAAHLGVSLEIVTIGADMVTDLPKLIFQLDEPQADLAPLNAWYISALARKQGVKVLLSGVGGDDLFAGYRRHCALALEDYWAGLPQKFRKLLEIGTSRLSKKHPSLRRLAKAFEYASLNQMERLPKYFHWLNNHMVSSLFAEPLTVDCDPVSDYLFKLPETMTPLGKMLQLDSRFFLADHNLNYTDKVSMAEGVEVRVPLIDLEMVHMAAKIPDAQKQRKGQGKWIFKKTMERLLPKEVIYRPKTGFGAPVRSWLQNQLSPAVDDLLSQRSLKSRGLFSHKSVNALIAMDRAGRVDAAYPLLSLMAIELWCRQFVDAPVPECRT